jgi:hypothetical protein
MKTIAKHLPVFVCAAAFLWAVPSGAAPPPQADETWQAKIDHMLPLLGHRNWILIVDSAYPLQTSPGVETIETNANQIDVVREVLNDIDQSIHVRPIVYIDAELPFIAEQGAPGVTHYREEIKAVLGDRRITRLPHENIIGKIDEAGRRFHVLVLKTKLTIPYTSVFSQLNCKYWSDSAEEGLRNAMKNAKAQ